MKTGFLWKTGNHEVHSLKCLEVFSCEMRIIQNQIKIKINFVAFYWDGNDDLKYALRCISGGIPTEKALRVADFNGDGLDDVLCHSRSGIIEISFNTFSKLGLFHICSASNYGQSNRQ